MTTKITSEEQLEALLNEMLSVYSPKPNILTTVAEVYLVWSFGLVASAVIYYFNVEGWGLQFLVYVLGFQILQTGFVWFQVWHMKQESNIPPSLLRALKVFICIVSIILTTLFVFYWKIPIHMVFFMIVFFVHTVYANKNDRWRSNPNLGLLPYLRRPDGRIVSVIFAAYQAEIHSGKANSLFMNTSYRNRFYTVALHNFDRFYTYPDDEDKIVDELNQVIGSILIDFSVDKNINE